MSYTEWRDNLRNGPSAKRHWTAAAVGATLPAAGLFLPLILVAVGANILVAEISKRGEGREISDFAKTNIGKTGFGKFISFDGMDYLKNTAAAAGGLFASAAAMILLSGALAAQPQDFGSNDVLDLDKTEFAEAAPQMQLPQPAYRFTPV